MSMEKHRCKLCLRIFPNGRALGGHMRSHLAKTEHQTQLGGDETESDSSSTRSGYELRENPRKSVRALDPDQFFDAGSVVQDRESETESTQNPTRRRSKRGSHNGPKLPFGCHNSVESKKRVKGNGYKGKNVKSESATESNPVSSVSDASQDEEVALWLMMLSRDVWVKEDDSVNDSAELKRPSQRVARFKCLACKKNFRTSRALAGHKASSKECYQQESSDLGEGYKVYECPFCYKVFGSGQALGGHKRSHLLGLSSINNNATTNANANANATNAITNVASNVVDDDKVGETTTSFVLDLNLPAPVEDDDDQFKYDVSHGRNSLKHCSST